MPYPCSTCGSPGIRDLGTDGFCEEHLLEFFQRNYALRGYGLLVGLLRPEFGPGYGDLKCNSCGATWVGRICTPCQWCVRSMAQLEEFQRDLVLTEPQIDSDMSDHEFEARMKAWGERLRVQVKTYLITKEEAQAAYDRAIRTRMESRRHAGRVHAGGGPTADPAGRHADEAPIPEWDPGAETEASEGAPEWIGQFTPDTEPW